MGSVKVSNLHQILLTTAKLHAEGDGETATVVERARVGGSLVNTEAQGSRDFRIVGEDLFGEGDWG